MQVTGPQDFAAAMHRLEQECAGELDAALVRVATETILPVARRRAAERIPGSTVRKGEVPGELAASIAVVPTPRGVVFKSSKPYANVQHWGGTSHRTAVSVIGESQAAKYRRAQAKWIPPKHFVAAGSKYPDAPDAVKGNVAYEHAMQHALEALIEKYVN